MLSSSAAPHARCNVLFYANGIGTIHLEGEPAALISLLASFRSSLERNGGSLVVHHFPAHTSSLDAWGTPPDSFPLMRAVKHQFDPKNTLNPGRFVGGI
jgi:glycolate dehydrogenase FAD-binding subunit